MDEVVVRTDVYVTPTEAFDFLRDFPGYAEYSEHLTRVDQHGDGGAGTVYEIEVSWWRLSYTARTEVTGIDRDHRLDWRALESVDAEGEWEVEPIERPESDETGSRVTLRIRYAPETADATLLDLPRFVSLAWIVDRVRPVLHREAEAVVERIVADLEGEPRPVELEVETRRG